MAAIWEQVSEFVGGIFGVFQSIITSATGSVIGLWMIIVPLFGLAVTYVTRLVHAGSGKKKKGK